MAELRAKVAPTHVLRVEIPLDLSQRSPDFDAVADATRLALMVSRAAYVGEICNDPQVELTEVADG